jgi:hypothetical protein
LSIPHRTRVIVALSEKYGDNWQGFHRKQKQKAQADGMEKLPESQEDALRHSESVTKAADIKTWLDDSQGSLAEDLPDCLNDPDASDILSVGKVVAETVLQVYLDDALKLAIPSLKMFALRTVQTYWIWIGLALLSALTIVKLADVLVSFLLSSLIDGAHHIGTTPTIVLLLLVVVRVGRWLKQKGVRY